MNIFILKTNALGMGNLLPEEWTFSALELKGADARDFGQRMFSRDLKPLAPRDGVLSAFLTAEGRVSELFWVILLENSKDLLVLTPAYRIRSLHQLIEKYHFAEKFAVLEHNSPKLLVSYWEKSDQNGGIGNLSSDTQIFQGHWRGIRFSIDLKNERKLNENSEDERSLKLKWDQMRIEKLIPEIGRDYDDKTLVFDLGLDEVCDPGKGCYIGQEVVERIRTRGGGGAALKSMAAVQLDGQPEQMEGLLGPDGQPVGQLLGSVLSDGRALAVVKKSVLLAQGVLLKTSRSGVEAKIVSV